MLYAVTIDTKGVAFLSCVASLLVLLGMSGMVLAAPTEDLNITLNITAEVSIDVSPDTLFIQAAVGETTGYYPDDGTGVRIINVGSLDVGTIRANVTMANSNPFGSGDPANYNAGDYIQMNASQNASFRWINSRHWNESKPGNVVAPAGWQEGHQTGYYVQIRTASDQDEAITYHSITNSSDSANCSNSSTGVLISPFIRIANIPKNITEEPDYDFTDPTNYTQINLSYTESSGGTPYGAGKILSGDDLGSYCVLVSQDCATITLFHWGRDWDFSDFCDADQYVYSGTLTPGQSTPTWYRAKIPGGVDYGTLGYGIVWFTATAA